MKPFQLHNTLCYQLIFAALCIVFTFNADASQASLSTDQLKDILSSANRPAKDADRDSARQPEKILAFTGVAQGDTILELLSGGGWYTELLSKAVGPEGTVYMHNDQVYWKFSEKEIKQRTQDNRLDNVVRLDNVAIADIEVADNSVDLIFSALGYHDLFFTNTVREGKIVPLRDEVVDYAKALAKIKRLLKDEGIVVIIDHSALAGSGYQTANTLHRIDPNIVKYHFMQAGFTLIEEAFYLGNHKDPLAHSVFDPAIRGKTDRFIFKFTKTPN